MVFEVNFELKETSLCLEEMIILSLLLNKKYKELKKIHQVTASNLIASIEKLEEEGYVKIIDEFVNSEIDEWYPQSVSLREKAVELFEDTSIDLEAFVKQYRDYFPPNFRGDYKGCKDRMKRFIRENRSFSPDIILRATKEYNEYITLSGGYRRQAHYFILKDRVSDLARYCENLLNGESVSTLRDSNSIQL